MLPALALLEVAAAGVAGRIARQEAEHEQQHEEGHNDRYDDFEGLHGTICSNEGE